MKFAQTLRLSDVAQSLGCRWVGDPNFPITGINEIHRVEEGDICFVDHPKYYQKALNSRATTIIIDQEVDCPPGKALIISPTPFLHFNELTRRHRPFEPFPTEPQAQIGRGSVVMPHVTLDQRVVIGEDCIIFPGVVIYGDVVIGDRVIIHANAVIGGDAFYYNRKEGAYKKMHSCGRVIIGNDVEIGAGTTIDRGVTADTIIGSGTKIDNQCQVAHDTVIGEHCLIAAQSAIAGCTTIGNRVIIWGQVAIISGIEIGDGAEILAQSGVGRSLEGGKRYFGSPAEEARTKMREMAAVKRLAEGKNG
ncbi:MAG TPA: UDP-3-O-(3-hydroxymyristoyl)glucosamine N-acyltransferase [Luteibaculaceae bacterium]|jgi:UDP-3-O-[3-hydroxymyristoyl] glucosamine N-acyltransferase|nr:UDP-3-O-(3-hydroxymyristoyl)glucosamine N-acyltransferase [Luteibaculaceae bacterium]